MTRILALLGVLLLTPAPARRVALASSARVDFNGDGYADAVFRNSYETFSDASRRGANTVLYGSADGLDPSTAQLWHAGVVGLPDLGVTKHFGRSMDTADLDGDGFTDLALALGCAESACRGSGAVLIMFGSSEGLSPGNTRLLRQGQDGLSGDSADPNNFGAAIRAGRFDTSRAGVQLAVLASHEFEETLLGSTGTFPGAVHIIGNLRGDLTEQTLVPGPTTTPDEQYDDESMHLCSLDSGSFNDDDADELILGVFHEVACESQHLVYGGLPGSSGVAKLGYAGEIRRLARETGRGVLAVGSPYTKIGEKRGGAVHLRYTDAEGMPGEENIFVQHSDGVPGGNEWGDLFGQGLHLGDLQGDGILDLVIGAPGEDLDGLQRVGAVTVIRRNAAGGVSSSGTYAFSQSSRGIPGKNEAGDFFGYCVSADDFNGDGIGDFLVDSAGETIAGIKPGVVTAIYSGATPARLIHQDTPGIPGGNEYGDRFDSCGMAA